MDVKEKQKLLVLFGIFAFAALIVYYNLLLRPQFSTFIANNREFCNIKKRVTNAKTLIANEERIKRQYENLKKQSEILKKRFPAQDEISSLLEDFSSIAESSRVKILKIKPLEVINDFSKGEAEKELYSEFPILIEARGGYHQCGIFINTLENMDRFIQIEDVDIKGRTGDPRHHDIKLRVSIFVMQ